jgi:hypothetical protein
MCLLINLQAVNPLPMMLPELFRLAFNHGKLLATADRNHSLGETMKRLRQLCAATVLTVLLTNIASADDGVMHPVYAPTPTPTPLNVGIMHPAFTANDTVATGSEEPATDLEMEITLYFIQNILALF